MELTREEGKDLAYEEIDGWSIIKGTKKMIDQRRWVTVWQAIFEHLATGRHYRMSWELGSTEGQDCIPFEYDDPKLVEVELKEVTIKRWIPVGV